MPLRRTPPPAVTRQLRIEQGFVCVIPQCTSPFLEWHHFDPLGPLFSVIDGPPAGDHGQVPPSALIPPHRRSGRRQTTVRAASAAPHAVELAREGVALNIIQRQLGHANLGTTSVYLQGIDTEEISPPSTPDERR